VAGNHSHVFKRNYPMGEDVAGSAVEREMDSSVDVARD
jgi:hypothetical protein